MNNNFDFCIAGGGMVGLSIANQILERKISSSIVIIDKEPELGLHSSGLNSGVLHSGLYYEPKSLKAKVCVSGAKRLKRWVIERNLPLNECGKVIVPQDLHLDNQLDLLFERGIKNGVRKINIDTDCRIAITGAIRKTLSKKPKEFDPRKYLGPAMDAMKKVCLDRLQRFGAEGMASKIEVKNLDQMATLYL